MKYRMLDGAVFEAGGAEDLLAKMRGDSFNPGTDLQDYLRITAGACQLWNGKRHRSESAEELLEDMMTSGLVTPL